MQLSKKQTVFSQIFAVYLKGTSNHEHVLKKNDPHSLCISEINDCEKSC